MTKLTKQMLDGNVETMLMTVLMDGASYGYAIVRELNGRAEGLLRLGEGTVYPVLHRMEEKGLISACWQLAENGRQRKYYRLTHKGHRALAENRQQWSILSELMNKIAETPGGNVNLEPEGA